MQSELNQLILQIETLSVERKRMENLSFEADVFPVLAQALAELSLRHYYRA